MPDLMTFGGNSRFTRRGVKRKMHTRRNVPRQVTILKKTRCKKRKYMHGGDTGYGSYKGGLMPKMMGRELLNRSMTRMNPVPKVGGKKTKRKKRRGKIE